MRLNSVTIRNFKGIQELTLKIPETRDGRSGSADFLTILGRNNVGKSTVLEAIRLALPGSEISKPLIDHFPEKKVENGPIEVEFEFNNITEDDKEQQGIRTHVFNDSYRIKKVWNSTGVQPDIWAYHVSLDIPSWPETDTTRKGFLDQGDEWKRAIEEFEKQTGEQLSGRISKSKHDALRKFLIESKSSLVEEGEPSWQLNPGGIKANVDAILPYLIFVPALKETKAEAGVSEKNSAARQIIEVMFKTQLANNPAISMFTEAGNAVKELFAGGGEGHEVISSLEKQMSDKLGRLIPLSVKMDFTPPDISSDLASKTVLELSEGVFSTKPEHQGHGAQRALVLSLLELFAELNNQTVQEGFRKGILLLIEEPEIYLHPQMCRKMRDVILSIARSGTAQVICTSHSPVFIDLADRHDGIFILRKDPETKEVTAIQRVEDLFNGDTVEDARNRLRMLLDFDPTVMEAFFASRVCLVEGDCEVASIDAVANRLSKDGQIDINNYLLKRREVSIINCRGKWTIRAFQRVLNGFDIPYMVIHDNDSEGDSGANKAILNELGGNESRRKVHSPNFEQQIFGDEWTRDKPWKATQQILQMGTLPSDLLEFFYFVTGITPEISEEYLTEAASGSEI